MSKLLCRVVFGSDSHIYLVSNRIQNLSDGDYIIDEENIPFVIFTGYYIALDGRGVMPHGELSRIEASNNKKLKLNRFTHDFKAVVKDPSSVIRPVYIRVRANGYLATNEKGRVMVKPRKL